MKVPLGADEVAGPGRQAGEGDAVALGLLLDARGLEVVQHHRGEIAGRARSASAARAPAFGGVDVVDQFVLVGRHNAVRRRLSTVNGPATRTRALST